VSEYLSTNSKLCGHSYSRAAIQDFLKRAGRKSCPASGCNKWITMDDLIVDKELEKRIKIVARRQQRQEESENDDDDDNVIE
jgi:SUMO ligase MMS21 Smc5/6 complex component